MNALMRGGYDKEGNVPGVTASNGKVWKEHRNFMLGNLSDLGMGRKDTVGDIVEQETTECINLLKERVARGETISSHGLFMSAINNVIWRIISGLRNSQTDPKITALTSAIRKSFDALNPMDIWNVLMMNNPGINNALHSLGLPSFTDRFTPVTNFVHEAMAEAIPDKDGNLGDRYLAVIEKNEKLGKINATLSGAEGRRQIFGGFIDVIMAGTLSIMLKDISKIIDNMTLFYSRN